MKTKNKSFKRLFAFLVALVMVTALVPSVIFAADPTFPDVPTTHWAYDYIEKLAKAEIIGGYADGTFGPEDNVTRQQAAKMIAGAADLEAGINFTSKFTDLDKVAAELKPFVLALEENKVAGGFADGSFGPTLNIKRSQAAKMIVKAFGIVKGGTAVSFADPVADATDQSYIDILASNGIVKGYTEDGKQLFKPYNLVTRAQLAKMIVEAMDWEPELVTVAAFDQVLSTVKNDADEYVELEFLVNGQKLTASSFEKAFGNDYEVKFYFTSTYGSEAAQGKIASEVPGEFEYAVQIIDEDGKKYPAEITSADYAEVEIVDPTVPVKITEYGLYHADDLYADEEELVTKVNTKKKLDFVALGDEDVYIVATKAENGLGKAIDVVMPAIKATSSNIAIASYDDVDGIDTNAVGKVTFKANFEDIVDAADKAIDYSLATEVKAARVATAIDKDNEKIKIADAAATTVAKYFVPAIMFLDQYGDEMDEVYTPSVLGLASGQYIQIRVKDASGKTLVDDEAADVISGNPYDLTKGVNTVRVSVYKDNALVRVLGTYNVEAVVLSGALTYKLVPADDADPEVDANPLLTGDKDTLKVGVEVYQSGVEIDLPYGEYKVKSSDDDIATVDPATFEHTESDPIVFEFDVVGTAAGSVKITLYKVDGPKETAVATLTVVVKNTAPQITDLKLKTGVTKLTIGAGNSLTDTQLVSAQLAALDKTFDSNMMVEDVVFSPANGEAIVTLFDTFGGKSFTFPAEAE